MRRMQANTSLRTFTAVAGMVLGLVALAVASPEPTDCHSQVMLGANEEHFYFMVIRFASPGSYYDDSETVTICKKRRADSVVVEEHVVARREHHRDPNTLVDTTTRQDVDSFDVQEYLIGENINFARFHANDHHITVADSVLYVTREGRRGTLLDASEVLRQVKDLGPRARILGEFWVYVPGQGKIRDSYYLIQSEDEVSGCLETNIIAVSKDQLYAAWRRLARVPR